MDSTHTTMAHTMDSNTHTMGSAMNQHAEHDPMMERQSADMDKMPQASMPSHALSPNDPDNPMNWPAHRRMYASLVAAAMAFTVAYSVTVYTASIAQIMMAFNVNMRLAVLGYTIQLFGIFFAPIYTPHLSERYGRSIIYLISIFCCGFFHLGAGMSMSFASLVICRFLAGLTGGPCLVLIEGTFADVWSAETTNTYYSFLACASYFGAATGPLVGNFVNKDGNWRWTEYSAVILIAITFAFGVGMPETYGREIPRRRNKARGMAPPHQSPAESGVTIAQMATVTIVNPLKQLALEPIVMMISFALALNWAVTFQWFVTVPIVLQSVYKFTPQQAGLAMISAIGGASLAALFTIGIEQAIVKSCKTTPTIEKRLIPAMYGSVLMAGSLFWIGWTADPKINYLSPIFGTAVFIWGGLSVLISFITYLFDAYPPSGTLAALTAAACTRIFAAAIVPIFIIEAFMALGGNWALSIFGFIAIPLIAIPFVLYKFGPAMRAKSPYSQSLSIHSHVPLPQKESHMAGDSYEQYRMASV